MSAAPYSPGEVVYLLSLTAMQARDESVRWADSVGSMSADGPASSAGSELDPVLLISRWHDVHAARRRVVTSKTDAILELRLAGETTRDVAGAIGLSYPTVHRRFRATVDEVLAELGAEEPPEATSRLAACLSCGDRPRVNSACCAPCTTAGNARREQRRQQRRESAARVDAALRSSRYLESSP